MATIVSLELFEYDKKQKLLKAKSELFQRQFPKTFTIYSHHTNRKIEFKQDTVAAYYAEFWDGEQMEYIPVSPEKNVAKVVVYHG